MPPPPLPHGGVFIPNAALGASTFLGQCAEVVAALRAEQAVRLSQAVSQSEDVPDDEYSDDKRVDQCYAVGNPCGESEPRNAFIDCDDANRRPHTQPEATRQNSEWRLAMLMIHRHGSKMRIPQVAKSILSSATEAAAATARGAAQFAIIRARLAMAASEQMTVASGVP